MSLYADYIKEREDFDIVETDKGFLTYLIRPPEVYIRDIYVVPEHRQMSVTKHMIDTVEQIAKDKGCKYTVTTVDPNAKGAEVSENVVIASGGKEYDRSRGLIWYSRRIR